MIFICMDIVKNTMKFIRRICKIKIIVIECITRDDKGTILELSGTIDDEPFHFKKARFIRRVIEHRRKGFTMRLKTSTNREVVIINNNYLTTVCNKGSTPHLNDLPPCKDRIG